MNPTVTELINLSKTRTTGTATPKRTATTGQTDKNVPPKKQRIE